LEAGDGWWVLGAGIAMALLATLLVLRGKSFYAWLAFLVAILIGGIAFSDFNAVGDSSSELWRRMDRVGDVDAGFGLTLVAAAGVIGVIASVAGVAATPRQAATRSDASGP
jgi:O-antigen ligase